MFCMDMQRDDLLHSAILRNGLITISLTKDVGDIVSTLNLLNLVRHSILNTKI